MAETKAPALPKVVDPFKGYSSMVNLTMNAERLRLAQEREQDAKRAADLRRQETQSRVEARRIRQRLQTQSGDLAQDKHRFDVLKTYLKEYDDALKALTDDAQQQVQWEKQNADVKLRAGGLARASIVGAESEADRLAKHLGQYGAYAPAAITRVVQSKSGVPFDATSAADVRAFHDAMARELSKRNQPLANAYMQEVAHGRAFSDELVAYGLSYSDETKKRLVDERRKKMDPRSDPTVAAGASARIPSRQRSQAAMAAEEYLKNAPANFQKEMQGAGVQGAGSPLAGGAPGAPGQPAQAAQAVDQSPLRSLLKRALEHPGEVEPRQPALYASGALAGAPAISYREPDGSLTATNVPWDVSGKQKPEYFKRLRESAVGREMLEKPKPLAAAVKNAGAGGAAAGGDTKAGTVVTNPPAQGREITADDIAPPTVSSPGGPLGPRPGYAPDASFQVEGLPPWLIQQGRQESQQAAVPAPMPTAAPAAPPPAPKPLAEATTSAVAETAANQAVTDARQAAGPMYSTYINTASDDQIRELAKKHQSKYAPGVDPDAWADLMLQKSRASVNAKP